MKDNLVPERIVNKNGVHTTVYRKPGSSGAKKAPVLPSLALVPKASMSGDEILNGLIWKIREVCREQYSGINDVDQPTINRTLRKYSPETRERLYEFLDAASLAKSGSRQSVVAHAVAKGEDEVFISDAINFLPTVGKVSLLMAIRYYPQLHDLPLERIDPESETFRKVVALVGATDFIRYIHESNEVEERRVPPYTMERVPSYPTFAVLKDERLVDLLLERYKEVDHIRGIIQGHRSADYEVINAALDNGSALGDGTL